MHASCAYLLNWVHLLCQTLQTDEAHNFLGCIVLIVAIIGFIWHLGLIGRATVVIITLSITVLAVLVLSYLVHLHKAELNRLGTDIWKCVAAMRERERAAERGNSFVNADLLSHSYGRLEPVYLLAPQGMYGPLKQIEEINTRSRIRLTKLLSDLHQVRFANRESDQTESHSGAAFFFAFDPWDTCLRVPGGSFRYLTAAERAGLVKQGDMDDVFRTLLDESADTRISYRGYFSKYFRSLPAKSIFSQYKYLNSLTETGLDLGISSADILFETCPWPVNAERHLQTQIFRNILSSEINYSKSDWLKWTEALDVTCLGPWLGLSKNKILGIIRRLYRGSDNQESEPSNDSEILGQKVVISLFSYGFQGIVVGFFRSVPKEKHSGIISTLSQFGQTLADVYASARVAELSRVIESEPDEHALVGAIVKAVSPVKAVILEKDGRKVGYGLAKESDYWAGYRELSDEEMPDGTLTSWISFVTADGAVIYVDPISDIPGVDNEFAITRLETLLGAIFAEAASGNANALSVDEIQHLRTDFENYVREEKSSLAKWRQFYIVSKIEKNWGDGATVVSNSELKRFLQSSLRREVKSGYQVTSFAAEIEKIFGNKVALVKTRNVLSLSWSPAS